MSAPRSPHDRTSAASGLHGGRLAIIRSARHCVGHCGTEQWAITTICVMSDLDIHPAEVSIWRADRSGTSPTGVRLVVSGGMILGSYVLGEARS